MRSTRLLTLLAFVAVFVVSPFAQADDAAIFTLKAGATVEKDGTKTLSLTFEPHAGYYTEKDKPLKATLVAPDGVTVAKTQLGWADVTPGTEKTPTMKTTYTGEGTGKTVKASYRIGICEKDGQKLCHLKFGEIAVTLK